MIENLKTLNEEALDKVVGGKALLVSGKNTLKVTAATGAKVYPKMKIKSKHKGTISYGTVVTNPVYKGEDEEGNNWYHVGAEYCGGGFVRADQLG